MSWAKRRFISSRASRTLARARPSSGEARSTTPPSASMQPDSRSRRRSRLGSLPIAAAKSGAVSPCAFRYTRRSWASPSTRISAHSSGPLATPSMRTRSNSSPSSGNSRTGRGCPALNSASASRMRASRHRASCNVSAGKSARTYSAAARLTQRPAMRSSNSDHSSALRECCSWAKAVVTPRF